MSEKVFKLTRRRALGGLLTIGAGSAATGVGTFALFSDTESSTENTLSAGTLSLADGAASTMFSVTNLAPTEKTSVYSVILENDGTLDGSLDIDLSVTENDSDATAGDDGNEDIEAADFAKALNVLTFTVGDTDVLETSFNGSATVWDIVNSSGQSDDSSVRDIPLNSGNEKEFSFQVELQDVGNPYQADGVDITFDFELNQKDSQ
ncbi:TasA family protein (plasmid) [Haloferax sp. S1W]|uniref:TasA family protein n=1 Tax=Haloferax sp. S1W TaxID=3377110 RepID=UPI0037CA9C0D